MPILSNCGTVSFRQGHGSFVPHRQPTQSSLSRRVTYRTRHGTAHELQDRSESKLINNISDSLTLATASWMSWLTLYRTQCMDSCCFRAHVVQLSLLEATSNINTHSQWGQTESFSGVCFPRISSFTELGLQCPSSCLLSGVTASSQSSLTVWQ